MFFKELLGPKWKSRKAEVRSAAIAGLDVQQDREVLRTLACADPEATVRLAALRRMHDIALFRERLPLEADAGIQAFLAEHCARALCGQEASALSLAERLAWLAESEAALIERVAREGRELELRLAALDRVTRESLCAELAVHDPHIDLRLAALARVQKKAALERVWKEARTRDKRIARDAKARLDALVAEEQRPEQRVAALRQLCQDLEALQVESSPERHDSQLDLLDRQWQTLAAGLDEAARKRLPEDLAGRAERALAKARRHQQQLAEQSAQAARWAHARSEREQLCLALERLLDELRSQDREASGEAALARTLLDTQLSNWQHGPELPPAEQQVLDLRFRKALSACERVLAELPRLAELNADAESVLAGLRTLEARFNGEEEAGIDALATELSSLEQAWRSLPKLLELKFPDKLSDEFQRLTAPLAERVRAHRTQLSADSAEARKQLTRLEGLLNAGRTRAVAAQLNAVDEALARLPERHATPLRKRFDEMTDRLQELQDWRIWAALPRKEALCEELETLAAGTLPPREQGARLKAIQAIWKTLGTTEPQQDADFAQRYASALERAAAPVKAFQAEQKAERERNLAAREAGCLELEALAEQAEGVSVDWKALDAAYTALQSRWHAGGPLPAALWSAVHNRFRAAGKRVEAALRAEQARNTELKQALIAEAEIAVAQTDLRAVTDVLKQLQQRWKLVGRGLPRQEAAQWQRFRTLCDQAFSARQQSFDARRAAEQSAVAEREALCLELETLIQTGAPLASELDTQVTALERRWFEAAPTGREGLHLDKRWQQAFKQLAERKQSAQREQRHAAERLLTEKAGLCAAQERAGHAGQAERVARWAELAALSDTALESGLAARWQFALSASPDALAEAALAASQVRAELALRLEILAGTDSPPELAEARMRLQVSRLSERLRAGGLGAEAERRQLVTAWYLAGPMCPAQDELESRFNQTLAANQV